MLDTIKDKFHKSSTAQELLDLQQEIASYDTSNPAFYHLMKSHWLRENNKRAKILNFSQAIISPYDAGLRPIEPIVPASLEEFYDDIYAIDGSDMYTIAEDDLFRIGPAYDLIAINNNNLIAINNDDMVLMSVPSDMYLIGGNDLVLIDGDDLSMIQ